ncbi:sensor histidine kinase [Rufibacter psychrotolerans]|uniref:sensor histidine kinase n=1 Tax=Rufibacter psychrotolerans TaxID=2812556 RepID=UPI001966F18E|nr:GAF domain-containing sensor histidine kinase [Rufibacter sp. SYSU D00308]
MIKPPLPENEAQRLKALERYQILDSLPEKNFDDLTMMASAICQTPISLITLIDANRQWFKSVLGVEATETPREIAFCAHAINEPAAPFIIPDATKDARFQDNPFVTGDPNVVFYAGVALNSPDGYALGTICVIDSKPKQLSEAQVAALKALANQVVSLLELRKKNRELTQLNQEVSRLNTSLSEFSYRVSHDLRAPLRGINNLAEWLLEEHASGLNEDGAQYVRLIHKRSSQLQHLIDGILLFSKNTHLSADHHQPVDLKELLEQVLDHCELPPNFSARYPQEPLVVHSSRIGLYQILQNLVTNSIKYNDKPTGELTVEYQPLGQGFRVKVTDNGPGIPADQRAKAFHLFETLASKKDQPNGSMGVGLATVQSITTKLGGSVSITDREDGQPGACFLLEFGQ